MLEHDFNQANSRLQPRQSARSIISAGSVVPIFMHSICLSMPRATVQVLTLRT